MGRTNGPERLAHELGPGQLVVVGDFVAKKRDHDACGDKEHDGGQPDSLWPDRENEHSGEAPDLTWTSLSVF